MCTDTPMHSYTQTRTPYIDTLTYTQHTPAYPHIRHKTLTCTYIPLHTRMYPYVPRLAKDSQNSNKQLTTNNNKHKTYNNLQRIRVDAPEVPKGPNILIVGVARCPTGLNIHALRLSALTMSTCSDIYHRHANVSVATSNVTFNELIALPNYPTKTVAALKSQALCASHGRRPCEEDGDGGLVHIDLAKRRRVNLTCMMCIQYTHVIMHGYLHVFYLSLSLSLPTDNDLFW